MKSIYARNVNDAYKSALIVMRQDGCLEKTRNGPALVIEDLVCLEIANPTERVLFDYTRDCNPFFHVMEFCWMMAGSNDSKWISQFNRKFASYADLGTTHVHGAYGHRWIRHFGHNQLQKVTHKLLIDPTDRQCVVAMWDAEVDQDKHNDIPCNTQLMFRAIDGDLNMTVINRSNDMIWGMLGANAVHMTLLHELIAHLVHMHVGIYRVVTQNMHIYTEMPKFKEIMEEIDEPLYDPYPLEQYPLLDYAETFNDLHDDCVNLIDNNGDSWSPKTDWMRHVALPMHNAYMSRLEGGTGEQEIRGIEAADWQKASMEYIWRRKAK